MTKKFSIVVLHDRRFWLSHIGEREEFIVPQRIFNRRRTALVLFVHDVLRVTHVTVDVQKQECMIII